MCTIDVVLSLIANCEYECVLFLAVFGNLRTGTRLMSTEAPVVHLTERGLYQTSV
jgi:hypothetical protein